MKKILMAAISMVLCTALLSGCMSVKNSLDIKADGTGVLSTQSGMTEEGLLAMIAMGGVEDEQQAMLVLEEMKKELEKSEINGTVYYSVTETQSFANLGELNEALSELGNEMEFHNNDDGTIGFTYLTSKDGAAQMIGLDEKTREEMFASGEISEEEFMEFMQSLMMGLDLSFPGKVTQIKGPKTGITVSGNKLSIDVMALIRSALEGEDVELGTCEFVIDGINTTVPEAVKKPAFSDVSEDKWYYEAVSYMSETGVVNGMGNGTFVPEANMTYAEFCQLLTKLMEMEVGELNGYWAGEAISFCVEAGLIENRGAYTADNYDVAITREAAIAAMSRALEVDVVNDITADDIPDFDTIDAKFREDVLSAYRIGITTGVDEKRTFLPKRNLSRAEVCQLFYNVVK